MLETQLDARLVCGPDTLEKDQVPEDAKAMAYHDVAEHPAEFTRLLERVRAVRPTLPEPRCAIVSDEIQSHQLTMDVKWHVRTPSDAEMSSLIELVGCVAVSCAS